MHIPFTLAPVFLVASTLLGSLALAITGLQPQSGTFWAIMAVIVFNASYWAKRYWQLQQDCTQHRQQLMTLQAENLPAANRLALNTATAIQDLQQIIALAGQGNLSSQIDLTQHSPATLQLATDTQYMLHNLQALLQEVQNAGILVLTSLTDMSANAWELESTAQQQTQASHHMSQQTTQIKQTTQVLTQTVAAISTLVNHLVPHAVSGQDHLHRMHQTMNHISQASGQVMDKLLSIHHQSQHINRIVSTMTKIASQTNLLSLNAAMEAEKAKEYGRGFAVVASEIRRLADQTAIATLDIEKMVKAMQKSVTEGVSEMKLFAQEVQQTATEVHQTSQQLTGMIEQIRTLTPRFTELDQGMTSQANAANHISTAIAQLNTTTAQMTLALKKSNRTLEQLKNAAQGLQKGVSQFKVKHG